MNSPQVKPKKLGQKSTSLQSDRYKQAENGDDTTDKQQSSKIGKSKLTKSNTISSSERCVAEEDHIIKQEQKILFKKQICEAKAKGKTVSIIDGTVYIDYQYIGKIPDGFCF